MDKRIGLLGVVAMSFAFALPAAAAEISKSLDVRQGFYFQAGAQASVGCIRAMKLGTTALDADLDTSLPTTPDVSVKCVAVMSDFAWSGGAVDPLSLGGRVSVKNKQTIGALVAAAGKQPLDVVFQYAVYEYDPIAKRYFLGAGSNGSDLKGTVEPGQASVETNAAIDVSAPQNHGFSVSIKPKAAAQVIRLGTGAQRTISKAWGLPKA